MVDIEAKRIIKRTPEYGDLRGHFMPPSRHLFLALERSQALTFFEIERRKEPHFASTITSDYKALLFPSRNYRQTMLDCR